MPEQLTITKAQLTAALARWEQDHRDGKCRSAAQTADMPVEMVADESAAALWESLKAAQ